MAGTATPIARAATVPERWDALPEGDKGIITAGAFVAAALLCLCLAVLLLSG